MEFEHHAIWSHITSLISFPTCSKLSTCFPQKEQVHCCLWDFAPDGLCPRIFFPQTSLTLLLTFFRSLSGVTFSVKNDPDTLSSYSYSCLFLLFPRYLSLFHVVFIIFHFGSIYYCLLLWLSASQGLWVKSGLPLGFVN